LSSVDTALQPAVARDQARALFGQTMGLVAVTAGLFALGVYIGRDLAYGWGIGAYIASFDVLIGLDVGAARSEQLVIGLLFGFGVLIGVGRAPTIAYYASTNPIGVAGGRGDRALQRRLRHGGLRHAPRPLRHPCSPPRSSRRPQRLPAPAFAVQSRLGEPFHPSPQ
jgi:hypothetical protein